jgi:hypothetical protein
MPAALRTGSGFQIMCILCNADSLRLLVMPLDSITSPQLAEAVGVAREAAMQLVLDAADAWADEVGSEEAIPVVEPEGFVRYAVERAEHDGLIDTEAVEEWRSSLEDDSILRDARVQAFLSSAVEGLAIYSLQIREKRRVLERYLEVPRGAAVFGGVGASGEITFEFGDDRYIVLSDDEALQIAMDHIASELWKQDPAVLLRYTSLPDDGVTLLASAQREPQDRANEILAGIIDLPLLVEDRVRQVGYGRFVTDGITTDFEEQRFGDVVVLRLRGPFEPDDDF